MALQASWPSSMPLPIGAEKSLFGVSRWGHQISEQLPVGCLGSVNAGAAGPMTSVLRGPVTSDLRAAASRMFRVG